MLTLSRKVQQGQESQTLALAAKAKRMKDSGTDVANLIAGEPDFPTPRHVKEAAIKAIEADFTKYTANAGSPDLIDAIINKFANENNLHFEPDQILVSSGAKQSLFNALQAICNKGDEVVIISPYWVSYPEMVKLVDAVPMFVKTNSTDQFLPNIKALARAINQKTKALILNSPNNPTGTVYNQSVFEEIAALVRDAGIYVISDEIYEKIIYDGRKHFSIGSIRRMRDHAITVNGMSKGFAMTGWRVGYMGGPRPVIEAASKFQSQVTLNANSIAQKATIAALQGSMNELDAMLQEFKRRRDFVVESLSSVRGVMVPIPQSTFYLFLQTKQFYGRSLNGRLIKNSIDLSDFLLQYHLVGTVPGAAFGDDDCLRISYACSMGELEKGMARLRTGFEQLQSVS